MKRLPKMRAKKRPKAKLLIIRTVRAEEVPSVSEVPSRSALRDAISACGLDCSSGRAVDCMAQDQITLAAITGAHGVAGEVRLKLLGEGVEALRQHTSFNDGALTLKKIRSDNTGGAIARFAECASRNEAEKLRGTALTISRDALPKLAEGEYYHADLIGLSVETDAGQGVGEVIAVQNFGATDIIEIRLDPPPAKGIKTIMVPMTKQAVLEWDASRLVISKVFAEQ